MVVETAVDFLLDDLNELLKYRAYFEEDDKDEIEHLHESLVFIRAFLYDSQMKSTEDDELKNLVTQIRDVCCDALDDLDSLLLRVLREPDSPVKMYITARDVALVFNNSPSVRRLKKEMNYINKVVMGIYDNKFTAMPQVGVSSGGILPRTNTAETIIEQGIVVGFDGEAETIIERLTGEQMQLDVISIIGMAGLGKTTLALRVYNDPFIMYHFYIRRWSIVSQVYCKRDLLLNILGSFRENNDQTSSMIDEELGQKLYKELKDRRYLIVLDDIWDIEVWNDLMIYFPNDGNRSRILLTSRINVKPDSPPHCLRFLTPDESWDLFQQKVFGKESCPQDLMEIGKKIAEKCCGLPLAIVVVAGLLSKEEKRQHWWNQLTQTVSLCITGNIEKHFMDILSLSYDHLPQHLKVCFLYFGEFPEDYEIPVWDLISSWIAEGFVQQIGQQNLEDVAEDYLMDLVDRNMVMIIATRSDGGIKSCRIHDMLRDLCLRKVREQKRVLRSKTWIQNKMCFHSHGFHYCHATPCSPHVSFRPSTHLFGYKFMRVLDLRYLQLSPHKIRASKFPLDIFQLIHLKFLALKVNGLAMVQLKISNLHLLETLIIHGWGVIVIPHSIWNLVKLRHLHISGGIQFKNTRSSYGSPCILDNLQTISKLPSSDIDVLTRTPNLKKLGFIRDSKSCDLSNLIHLQSLSYTHRYCITSSFPQPSSLPPNLKKFTLSGYCPDWKDISTLEMLPNLEILKLKNIRSNSGVWKTDNGGFCRLKFLMLKCVDLEHWIASSSYFPSLQKLVLHKCNKLQEIPSDIGYIYLH